MVALISEEQENTSGSMRKIILEKQYKKQEFKLVVLLVVTIYAKILLQSFVHTFNLSIIFRIVTLSKSDMRKNAVLGKHMKFKELC